MSLRLGSGPSTAARWVGSALGGAALALPLWPETMPGPRLCVAGAAGAAYLVILARAVSGRPVGERAPAVPGGLVGSLALGGGLVVAASGAVSSVSIVLALLFGLGAAGVASAWGRSELRPPQFVAPLVSVLCLAGLVLLVPAAVRLGWAAGVAFAAPGLAWSGALRPGSPALERVLWAPVFSVGLLMPSIVWASALGWRIGPEALFAICLVLSAAGLAARRFVPTARS